MPSDAENDDRLIALVPAFHVNEFATVDAEYSASKGMSKVTMWVSKERGNDLHAAGMKLRKEIGQRAALSSDETPSMRPYR
jgi:hypothetical protein